MEYELFNCKRRLSLYNFIASSILKHSEFLSQHFKALLLKSAATAEYSLAQAVSF